MNFLAYDVLDVSQNLVTELQCAIVMCVLTECSIIVFCIWPDGGSVNRNMSPNFEN
jgi:hypothetical protein